MPDILSKLAVKRVDDCIGLRSGYLVTINMQHLYECIRHKDLHSAIFTDHNSMYCLDGRGAHNLFCKHLGTDAELVTGVAVTRRLLNKNSTDPDRIYDVVIVGSNTTSVAQLRSQYPNVSFRHMDRRFSIKDSANAHSQAIDVLRFIGNSTALVVIALGVPKQELLAQALSRKNCDLHIICIGGALEIISRIKIQSPRLVSKLWLDPFWRFAIEPTRARVIRLFRSYFYYFLFRYSKKQFERAVNGE